MYIPYVVQPGDSLYYIAKVFCTSEEEVIAANRLVNPALIQVGQLLYIPVSEPVRSMQHPGAALHRDKLDTVGEVLQRPAVRTTETPAAPPRLVSAAAPSTLEQPATALATTPPLQAPKTRVITVQSSQDTPTFRYAVQAGDTFTSLARRFGTTVDAMQQLNCSCTDPNRLPLGQSLLIPLPPRG